MNLKSFRNPNNLTVDAVVTTVPWTQTHIPLMAPAVLKPIIEQAGLTCVSADLNIEIYNLIQTHPHQQKLIEFFFNGRAEPEIRDWLEDMFDSVSTQILSWQPRYVLLSLFSYVSRQAAEWLCYYLKKKQPKICIIIGGAGCLEQFTGPGLFADDLIHRKLVDFHIRGDGEISLLELLKGKVDYPGINSVEWRQLDQAQIDTLPYPDYSDYDFNDYEKQMLGIHGSRGCVRTCTFCDYIANWKKFTWRSAENIFNEMLHQQQIYGIRHFKFHDTLTNGNLKEFNKLIDMLADYNCKHPEKSLSWGGYYIFREKSANDEQMWQTLKLSGADVLNVGIENLNQDIRYAIGKKFSNESIDFHLAQAKKHKIKLLLLFIVGYVTETQQHIDFSKQWLQDHVEYRDTVLIQWGGGLGIFPNTYLDLNKHSLGIKILGPEPHLWENDSLGNNPATRAQWVKELNQVSKQLGYNILEDIDNHYILESMLNDKSQT